jgi:hypothetical protein
MGITVDIKRSSGNIEIKSCTPAFEPPRGQIYVQLAQRILIKKGRDSSSPIIDGGPFTVPFHALLLDEPGEGEGDFVLTDDMLLHDLADCVWDAIDNAEMIKTKERSNDQTI